MNIFDRLVDEARKKKQQLETIGQPRPVAPAPRPTEFSPVAKQRIFARDPMGGQAKISRGPVMPAPIRPAPRQNPLQTVAGGFKEGLPTAALAAKRTAIGVGQDVTGSIDLLSRGTGTNRVSKYLHNQAVRTDEEAKRRNVEGAYKAAQVPLNIATFAVPGAAASKVTAIPRITKAIRPIQKATAPVTRAVNRTADGLSTRGAGGRIAGAVVRNTATPQMATDTAVGTVADLGSESGKGRDISGTDVAISTLANLGMGAALPAAGQAAVETVRAVRPAIKATSNAVRTANANKDNVANYDATVSRLQQRKAELQARQRQTTNFRGVETMQRHIEQIDNEIANVQANRPKLSVKDRVLAPNVGLSMKAVDPDNEYAKQINNLANNSSMDDMAFGKFEKQQAAIKKNVYGDKKLLEEKQTLNDEIRKLKNEATYNTDETAQRMVKAREKSIAIIDNELSPTDTAPVKSTTPAPVSPDAAVPAQQPPVSEPPVSSPSTDSVPERKLSKFANDTVQKSDEVSDPTKQLVREEQNQYDVTTNQARLEEAERRLAGRSDDDNFNNVTRDLEDESPKGNGQNEVTAISLAKKLDEKGDEDSLFRSTEIYARLSERFSKGGQEVQAASLLANRTPAGLQYGAVRDLKKNGIEVTPQRQKEIQRLVNEVKKAGDDVNKANLARCRLGKYVGDQIPTGAGSKIINLWRAGLLTAPTTTGGNILGNTGEAAVRKFFVNPLSSAIDVGFGAFTGKRTMTIAPAGSFTKGARQGANKVPQFVKTGYDERNALSKYDTKELNYGDGPVGKALNTYVNGTYRLMSLADQPFWYGARGEALASIAKAEAINKGFSGDRQKNFIKNFMDNPPTAAIERATQEAKYATFQDKTALGAAASGLKQGLRQKSDTAGAVGDFFVPFTQVPASIATRIVTHTPVGTATEVVKQLRSGQFDQRAMSRAIAEGSFGPMAFGVGYTLANSGLLTFGFPEDSKERELWEQEGKQPYSVKVNGRWYSMNYLQPFGTLLAIGGEAANAVKDGANITEVVSRGIATAGQSVLNQSFLKGISGVLEAVDDPKRYAEGYVANTAGSIVPNFIRSFARAGDEVQRETGGAITGIKQAIPGLRETTNEKLDMFGETVPAKDTFANQFLNPLRPSKDRSGDPVATELRRLLEVDQGVLPTAAKKNTFKDVELTDEQVRDINKEAGPVMKQEYVKLVASNEYKGMSDEDKVKALKKVNSTVFGALKAKYGVENGIVSADDQDLNTNQKRFLKGNAVDFLTDDDGPTYAEQYEEKLADKKKDGNSWSPVERAKKDREIEKLAVQKDYDKDTVDLYSMGKQDIWDLLSTDKNGQAMFDKLLAYGDAMEAAGLGKNKLRDSKGNVAIKPKESGSGGGSGRSIKPSDFMTPYDTIIQSRTKGAALARNAKLAKRA